MNSLSEKDATALCDYFQKFMEILIYPTLSDTSLLNSEWEYLKTLLKTYPLDNNRIQMYFDLLKDKAISKKIAGKSSASTSESGSVRNNRFESPALMNNVGSFSKTPLGAFSAKNASFESSLTYTGSTK